MVAFQRLNLLHYFYSLNGKGRWIGHCLDFDIVATAEDFKESERRLDMLVKRHIERTLRSGGACPLDAPAPEEFWNRWTDCARPEQNCMLPPRTLRIEVPAPVPMANPYGQLNVLEAKAA